MKLDRLELIHLKMPLVHFFETSFGRAHDHETVIVRAESGGVVGWGESPASASPGYSYETVHTVWHIIRDFLARKLKGVEIMRPGPIAEFFSSVRGHNMAKAGVEMAILDLLAKIEKKPLYQVLGGQRDEIPTGVSLGIEDRVDDLLKRVEQALAAGYQRVKVKIKPRWDIDVLYAIRQKFPSIRLMVDANSAYGLDQIEHLKKMDDYNLMLIEQPLDYDDYVDHAKLQKELRTPVCLDESAADRFGQRLEIGNGRDDAELRRSGARGKRRCRDENEDTEKGEPMHGSSPSLRTGARGERRGRTSPGKAARRRSVRSRRCR